MIGRLPRAKEITTAYSQDIDSDGWKTRQKQLKKALTMATGTEVYQTTPPPVLTKLEGQESKRRPEQRESFHFIHLLTRKSIKNNLSKESRILSPISEARAGLPILPLVKDSLILRIKLRFTLNSEYNKQCLPQLKPLQQTVKNNGKLPLPKGVLC